MNSIGVIGLQWGDEGKGKIVDFLSQYFDVVIRFQGGSNAGHTVIIDDKKYQLSLLPSGVLRKGVTSIIGNGVVIDPWQFLNEVKTLSELGIELNPDNLIIADNCHLVMEAHKKLDNFNSKIGTTLRGIGPCYEDKVGRRGIRVCDLLNKDTLLDKLKFLLNYHNILLKNEDNNIDEAYNNLLTISEQLLPYAKAPYEIKKLCYGKKLLFEGAQGALLDIDYGTYPFVTSSSTLPGQIINGSGLNYPTEIFGILKAYCTRVGSGPFPTEEKGEEGEILRLKGNELGTITGRPRRCGWFDAVLAKQYASLINATQLVITKLDILDTMESIKICYQYNINGQLYDYLPTNLELQNKIKPIYTTLPGWKLPTYNTTNLSQLPKAALDYIKWIEDFIQLPVSIISTGPKREQVIMKNYISK